MRLILSALVFLLAAGPVAAQTWQSGQGTEAVFAPLRSAFVAGADKMIDVADLDGAFVKSAVASGTALTLTVQNASDVEQTITFTPAGGGGAAASEETFIGTLGALTGVVQATFDNLFAITETLDVGDVFAVSVSPSAITVPSDGRYLGCADVQIEQTTDAQANGRVVGVVRFSVTSSTQ